jgi:hypothetical protein
MLELPHTGSATRTLFPAAKKVSADLQYAAALKTLMMEEEEEEEDDDDVELGAREIAESPRCKLLRSRSFRKLSSS